MLTEAHSYCCAEDKANFAPGSVYGLRFIVPENDVGRVFEAISSTLQLRADENPYSSLCGIDVLIVIRLYLLAICHAHRHFSSKGGNVSLHCERQAHDRVDLALETVCFTSDWHSHTGASKERFTSVGCSTDIYGEDGIFLQARKADHIIPKRRCPTFQGRNILFQPDTLVGEVKVKKSRDRLTDLEMKQLAHYKEYLCQGRAQCVFHWIAHAAPADSTNTDRIHSFLNNIAAKTFWKATTIHLFFNESQQFAACQDWLTSIGLHLLNPDL